MIINPAAVDAYIADKGLTPRLGDADWDAVLERVASLFGQELWHRCHLIHQAEDKFRRYGTSFPASVPRPYRFIYNLEFIAFESPSLHQLQQWLTQRGVVWRECRQIDPDSGQEEITGLQIYGYDLFDDA